MREFDLSSDCSEGPRNDEFASLRVEDNVLSVIHCLHSYELCFHSVLAICRNYISTAVLFGRWNITEIECLVTDLVGLY